jgi:hypothetical protein
VVTNRFGRRTGSALAGAGLVVGLATAVPPATSAPAIASSPLQTAEQARAHVLISLPALEITAQGSRSVGASQFTSPNWSGYVDVNSNGRTYQKVSGNWHQPAVKCPSSTNTEWAYFWVGIDGWDSTTVEQAGTLAECNKGKASYLDWWEMYPKKPTAVHTISPGDSISTSVDFTGGKYKLTVTDHTHSSGSFSVIKACGANHCDNADAEWITEKPGSSATLLADFGHWVLSGAAVTSGKTNGDISSFPDGSITMVKSKQDLVTVSGVHNGNSFSTAWHRSS